MLLDTREGSEHRVASDYFSELASVLALVPAAALTRVIDLLLDARAAGRRVYVMGNGGSSATASHLACDLVKTAQVADHRPLRVFALTDNTPLLTAWANDSAYERSFAEQVLALVEPNDIVIGISASGNSPNIVAGFMAATAAGARTVAFLGFDGGAARDIVEVPIHIPCHNYGLVEDAHSAIGHAITAAVRQALRARAVS